MEIKPIKESKENLYPTISKVKKTRFMGSVLLAATVNDMTSVVEGGYMTATPYTHSLRVYEIVRGVTFITAIIFLLLLIKNKIKIKKSINENEEERNKIKKYIKIELCLFIASLIAMIISHIIIIM